MRTALLLACSIVLLASCGVRQRQPASADPQDAAMRGRLLFQRMVDEQTYRGYGFAALNEVRRAELGRSMNVFAISSERLRRFGRTDDARALLERTPETLHPLLVDGEVRSSITVLHTGEGYRAVGFGDAALIKRLSMHRSDDAGDEFVVRVPWLYMHFLGRSAQDGFTLTPIEDVHRLDLRAGERYDANAVLQRLKRVAADTP